MPKMPEIEKVTNVYAAKKLRPINEHDAGGGNNGSFAQVLDQEEKKLEHREKSEVDKKIDEGLVNRLAGRMNSYNCRAMVAYFTMAYSTTDLRG